MSRKNPKMADTPTDVNTPSGAFHAALFVSSERWAEASKPVIYEVTIVKYRAIAEINKFSTYRVLAHQDATYCYICR